MESKSGVSLAVELAGTQDALAKQLGVTQQSIHKWVARGYVPMRRAQEIEALLGVPRTTLADPRVVELLSAWGAAL